MIALHPGAIDATSAVPGLERLRDPRWVLVGDETADGWENLSGIRLLELYRHRWGAVVALQPFSRLRALLLSLPAQQRFLYDAGVLVPWGAGIESSHAAQRSWVLRRPPDARGFGNDYAILAPEPAEALSEYPTLSVIVPVYNRREVLAKTLAGLAHQEYPRERFEVIVADDGSADRPEELDALFSDRLRLSWVRQEDRGYRLSAVRNLAIRAARHDVVVSLDCDMYPTRQFLRAHARWFAAARRRGRVSLMVLGDRAFVDSEALSVDAVLDDSEAMDRLPSMEAHEEIRPWLFGHRDWRRGAIESSHQLRNHPHPYTLASGGNVSYWREDAFAVGLYDEAFRHWGGEDVDFSQRVMRIGAYFIPEPGALASHQHHAPTVQRNEHKKITRSQLGARVPHYRRHCREAIVRPEVSVYIPARNAEPFIESAVRSALDQEFRDLEVCVVNDGSDDNTGAILDGLAKRDPRVRVVHRAERSGIAEASRGAVEMCRGELILQLDADDELLPGAVWALLDPLRREPRASLAYGGFVQVDETGAVLRENLGEPFNWERALLGNIASHPRMFRRRDYARTAGFNYSLTNAVDFDFYLRLAEVGEVLHVPRILYRYRTHGTNTSLRQRLEQINNHLRVARDAIARQGRSWTLDPLDRRDPTRYRILDASGEPVTRSTWSRIRGRLSMWMRS